MPNTSNNIYIKYTRKESVFYMFRNKRCYDRPMNFSGEATFNFQETSNMQEYPEAMPNIMNNNQFMGNNMMNNGCSMPPVYECPQERVVNREIVHEVPHICPINTRVVNHHIYKHTYTPCYTCCEENVCSNVYEGSCCNF